MTIIRVLYVFEVAKIQGISGAARKSIYDYQLVTFIEELLKFEETLNRL